MLVVLGIFRTLPEITTPPMAMLPRAAHQQPVAHSAPGLHLLDDLWLSHITSPEQKSNPSV
jgi:hypothetical protein